MAFLVNVIKSLNAAVSECGYTHDPFGEPEALTTECGGRVYYIRNAILVGAYLLGKGPSASLPATAAVPPTSMAHKPSGEARRGAGGAGVTWTVRLKAVGYRMWDRNRK